MGKGKGSSAPAVDPAVTAYNNYMLERQKRLDAQLDADTLEATTATNAVKATGQAGYNTYKQNLLNQYNAGLIDATQAQQSFKDYEDRYKLGTGFTQADLNELTTQATQQATGARQALAGQTYKDILGREAKAEELAGFEDMQIKSKGKYTLSDLVNSIKAGGEYTSKMNDNYLASYYDTMYGKQETTKSPEGYDVKTGRRTFTYNAALDPTFTGDVTKATGIDAAEAPASFTGTAGEIEEFQQAMRQKRDFMYNAGLTNLQGQIDKDTQKIKNTGATDVAKISTQGQLLSNLTAGFWS
jgi:hypothetical protein